MALAFIDVHGNSATFTLSKEKLLHFADLSLDREKAHELGSILTYFVINNKLPRAPITLREMQEATTKVTQRHKDNNEILQAFHELAKELGL